MFIISTFSNKDVSVEIHAFILYNNSISIITLLNFNFFFFNLLCFKNFSLVELRDILLYNIKICTCLDLFLFLLNLKKNQKYY